MKPNLKNQLVSKKRKSTLLQRRKNCHKKYKNLGEINSHPQKILLKIISQNKIRKQSRSQSKFLAKNQKVQSVKNNYSSKRFLNFLNMDARKGMYFGRVQPLIKLTRRVKI